MGARGRHGCDCDLMRRERCALLSILVAAASQVSCANLPACSLRFSKDRPNLPVRAGRCSAQCAPAASQANTTALDGPLSLCCSPMPGNCPNSAVLRAKSAVRAGAWTPASQLQRVVQLRCAGCRCSPCCCTRTCRFWALAKGRRPKSSVAIHPSPSCLAARYTLVRTAYSACLACLYTGLPFLPLPFVRRTIRPAILSILHIHSICLRPLSTSGTITTGTQCIDVYGIPYQIARLRYPTWHLAIASVRCSKQHAFAIELSAMKTRACAPPLSFVALLFSLSALFDSAPVLLPRTRLR